MYWLGGIVGEAGIEGLRLCLWVICQLSRFDGIIGDAAMCVDASFRRLYPPCVCREHHRFFLINCSIIIRESKHQRGDINSFDPGVD